MGGYGSGRHGGRPTVDDGLNLDLGKRLRDGSFRLGCGWGGTLRWTDTSSGRHVTSVGYQTQLGDESGLRWWFLCPRTGDHVAKLHLPSSALTFASRQAYQLAYRSQRETPRDRALGRALKLRRRLGSHEGIGEFIPKPKGMRWATFDREMAKVEAAEATVNGHTWALLQSLNKRLRR